jgi:xylulokinase
VSLLGIDVGTSGCKAAVFSEEGQLLALAYEEHDYQHPQPGRAELDSRQVWESVQRTIAQVAQQAQHDPVKALCVSSLGEAVVPVTCRREILGASLLNFDARGAEYLPELRARLASSGAGSRARSADEKWYSINGNTPGNQYSLTKLKWIQQHQPELYQRTDHFLHWSGFVSFMLGAEAAVDYSLANRTLLFDLERGDWSAELLELARLDRMKLPPAVPAGTIIGTLAAPLADRLGLPREAAIVSGAHDQCCNGVGCGVIEAGRAMYGMGTYICMMPVFAQRREPRAMIERGLNTEHHAAPGRYVSFIYNHGGSMVKWFRDTFAQAERAQAKTSGQDVYAQLTAEMPAGPSRILALPHWGPTGPPEFIDDSCGVMLGINLETTRGDILKGLIEATTFYLRECLESLPATGITIEDFRAVGGGSKSEAWLQIVADVMGRPVLRPQISEAGVLGAAIIAGAGCGVFPSLEAGVETMVKLEHTFEPQATEQARYDERFARYRQLWPLLRDYLRELKA